MLLSSHSASKKANDVVYLKEYQISVSLALSRHDDHAEIVLCFLTLRLGRSLSSAE